MEHAKHNMMKKMLKHMGEGDMEKPKSKMKRNVMKSEMKAKKK